MHPDSSKKQTIFRIWTYGHRPFVMGGTVNYVLATEVPCTGPHDLGGGYYGYLATAPNGQTFVAEAVSGAIVGESLKAVRKDIYEGDPAVMRKQVGKAVLESKEAEVHPAEFFWKAMRCAA